MSWIYIEKSEILGYRGYPSQLTKLPVHCAHHTHIYFYGNIYWDLQPCLRQLFVHLAELLFWEWNPRAVFGVKLSCCSHLEVSRWLLMIKRWVRSSLHVRAMLALCINRDIRFCMPGCKYKWEIMRILLEKSVSEKHSFIRDTAHGKSPVI